MSHDNSRITHGLKEFFQSDGWPAFEMPDGNTLQVNFQGRHGNWACYAQAREESSQLVFYSICPMSAPEAKRARVVEYITRANYGLIIGNFEMDVDDGEIR